jgi:hypothetical protein
MVSEQGSDTSEITLNHPLPTLPHQEGGFIMSPLYKYSTYLYHHQSYSDFAKMT